MEVNDLRSSIELLKQMEHQLVETDIEVDPEAELAGVYRHVGAGGTVMRPTTVNGPAMLFHNIKGHKDARVLIGLLASRERVAPKVFLLSVCPLPRSLATTYGISFDVSSSPYLDVSVQAVPSIYLF